MMTLGQEWTLPLVAWVCAMAGSYGLTKLIGRPAFGCAVFVGWATLPLYNHFVLATCPGDCAIRIDLLLVWPIIAIMSATWVGMHIFAAWSRRKADPSK